MNLQGMLTILPEQSLVNVNAQNPIFKQYLDLINKDINDNTMLAYTDGSALKNPGSTGAGVLIKVQGHKSIPVKLAKAISSKGTSFDGELAAILMATQYALTHLTKEHDSFNIYSSSSFRLSGCATCPITPHTRENYHNNTISLIRENLIEISLRISSIKMIYCPGHKGVCENEITDSLAKTGAKKARHLPCEMTATKEEIKKVNKKLTLQKWGRRWQNKIKYV